MKSKLFLEEYRKLLDKNKKLTKKETEALSLFLDMYSRVKDYFTVPQWAYVFATVFHETAHTFEPVKEGLNLSEEWRKRNLRYYPWYGRGYVQLTWEYNYQKFKNLMGIDYIENPDLVMQPELSFQILIYGMKHGEFTGRRIGRYINENKKDYRLARYVINGRDKRDLIASYAEIFEKILIKTT